MIVVTPIVGASTHLLGGGRAVLLIGWAGKQTAMFIQHMVAHDTNFPLLLKRVFAAGMVSCDRKDLFLASASGSDYLGCSERACHLTTDPLCRVAGSYSKGSQLQF